MLSEETKKDYKNSLPMNWVLTVTYGLLLAGAAALCIYSGIFAILFSLILFLPLFFSLYVSFYNFKIENKQELTFGKQISFFGLYFKDKFKGTFSFWKTFLITFIICFIIGIISTPIAYTIVNGMYPGAFDAYFKELNALIKEGFQYSKFMDLINKYYYALNPFMLISLLPPCFLAATYYLFGVSYSSLSFYYRASAKDIPSSIIDLCCSNAEKENRKSRLKDYFKEQWLFLALYVVGFWAVAAICIVFKFSSVNTLVFSVLAGTFLMSLYFPFYFIKMEQMYERHKDEFISQFNEYRERRAQSKVELNIAELENKDEQEVNKENNNDSNENK